MRLNISEQKVTVQNWQTFPFCHNTCNLLHCHHRYRCPCPSEHITSGLLLGEPGSICSLRTCCGTSDEFVSQTRLLLWNE